MAESCIDTSSSIAVNPNIFELEIKPKPILQHDIGAGAQCLNPDCPGCPGLELHFWRKMCMKCKCARDEHDIRQYYEIDPGHLRIGRLFDFLPNQPFWGDAGYSLKHYSPSKAGKGSAPPVAPRKYRLNSDGSPIPCSSDGSRPNSSDMDQNMQNLSLNNNNVAKQDQATGDDNDMTVEERLYEHQRKAIQADETLKQYSWLPTGVEPRMIHKYMAALPESNRPLIGTEGEKNRNTRLEKQLPMHDVDRSCIKTNLTMEEETTMNAFLHSVKKKYVGQGHVAEIGVNTEHGSAQCPHDATCKKCVATLSKGDVGIVAPQHEKTKDTTFHPNCFRCCECDELLVDMLYFFKDGKYYCGRHFADTMYPRCKGCDELIFAKEYTRAEESDWHLFHFCCFNCDLQLGGHRYMVKERHPYCLACYTVKFARTCKACGDKIGPDTKRITHNDFHWHATKECFFCSFCHEVLINRSFVMKNECLFCDRICKDKAAKSQHQQPRSKQATAI